MKKEKKTVMKKLGNMILYERYSFFSLVKYIYRVGNPIRYPPLFSFTLCNNRALFTHSVLYILLYFATKYFLKVFTFGGKNCITVIYLPLYMHQFFIWNNVILNFVKLFSQNMHFLPNIVFSHSYEICSVIAPWFPRERSYEREKKDV
jgi:hypothetical protein